MSLKTGKILQCLICKQSKYIPGKRLETFKYCSLKCRGISKRGLIPETAFKKNDPRITGQGNYQWKGNNASYLAKHRWMKKWFGKANHCEDCALPNKKYNWANVSGEYKRDIKDWKQLCISCHRRYDNWVEKMQLTRRQRRIDNIANRE